MRRMRLLVGVVALVATVCVAAPASAQSTGGGITGRVFGWGESQQMAAKDTFEAVTGETTMTGAGGGVEVHNLWRNVFVRGSVSSLKATGERVFVFDGNAFPLGIPLEVTMTPIELGAGWRFSPVGRRLVPYAGAGALWMKYSEQSDGDTGSERVNETYTGVVVFGGVDVSVWRFVSAGAEVAWRTAKVKDPAGSLDAFGEDNLGGVSFRVMVSIGR
jgi:hypothetical protein